MDNDVREEGKTASTKYKFQDIEQQHLKQLKILVLSMFPISYDNSFYKDILSWPVKRIAFDGNKTIGGLCARIETVDGVQKLYIAILGVIIFWRRRGIGKMLLDFVEDFCKENGSISSIYLHVQKDNKDAVEFYSRFGFMVTREVEDFYRRTACPTAIIMEKSLKSS